MSQLRKAVLKRARADSKSRKINFAIDIALFVGITVILPAIMIL